MEKILLKDDEHRVKNHIMPELKMGVIEIQKVVDAFNELQTGYTLKTEDLPTMIKEPDKFYHTVITKGEPVLIGGVPIKHDAHLKMMDLPKGFPGYMAKCGSLLSPKSVTPENQKAYIKIGEYQINEAGEIEIKPSIIEFYRESVKTYTKDDDQVKVFELLNDLCEAYNKLVEFSPRFRDRFDSVNMEDILVPEMGKKTIKPSTHYIVNFMR